MIEKERRKVTKNEKIVPTSHVTSTLLKIRAKCWVSSYFLLPITYLDIVTVCVNNAKSYIRINHLFRKYSKPFKNYIIGPYFYALLNPYALHILDVDVFPKLKLCIINLLFGVVFVIVHANDFWVLLLHYVRKDEMKYRNYVMILMRDLYNRIGILVLRSK